MIRTPLIIALLATPQALFAQDEAAALQGVIENQMRAFEARDISRAFSFASPMIQRLFGSPETFGQMVETGYPMVWNNADIVFLDARRMGMQVVQRVMVTDTDGVAYMLDYYMVPTQSGWRINGVDLVPSSDLSA
jgi:hypothetical protein